MKVLSTHSVGLDHIDVNAAKERGIKVGYLGDLFGDSVAEHAMCLTLMTLLRIKEHVKYDKYFFTFVAV